MPRPPGWLEYVNAPQTEAELAALRRCVSRGRPFGGDRWASATAARLGLGFTLAGPGRPPGRRPTAASGGPARSLFDPPP